MKLFLALALALTLSSACVLADATIIASTQGHLPLAITGYSYSVVRPPSAAGGRGIATGKLQYGELVLLKPIDKSSPQLAQAFFTNEALTRVDVTLPSGTVTLKDAFVMSFSDDGNSSGAEERVGFAYRELSYNTTNETGTTNQSNQSENATRPAPFHIAITPNDTTVDCGQNVKYLVTITPDPRFNGTVNLTLYLDAALMGDEYNLGEYPVPDVLNYTFLIPRNIPFGLDIDGRLAGTSEGYEDDAALKLHINGPARVIGNSLNWLFNLPGKIRGLFS